ncbi:MAG: hypothetical protein CMJ87_12185 [Planctomycetes bacterium]|nr:hypothetical protein [Planctomycetota bacterium]
MGRPCRPETASVGGRRGGGFGWPGHGTPRAIELDMDSTTSPAELASILSGSLAQALLARGVSLEELEGEAPAGRRNRLETGLMALVRDTGDEAAFEALHALSHRHLLNWVRSRILPGRVPLDAQEILQDAFVNIFCYRHSFRDEGGRVFGAWARTIAANAVRRAAKQPARFSFQALPEGLQEPMDRRALPDQVASQQEDVLHLRRAMGLFLLHYQRAFGLLGERDRAILEWVEIEGRSYVDLGRELGLRPNNIKVIVFRARLRLRAEMRRAMEGALRERAQDAGSGAVAEVLTPLIGVA